VEYVRLGSAGLQVSRICLGMMSYGTAAERAWHLDEATAEPIVKAAVKLTLTEQEAARLEEPYVPHPVLAHR
jgi:aryl-alcohol dehydrogenase-like predicted oxidoreductase